MNHCSIPETYIVHQLYFNFKKKKENEFKRPEGEHLVEHHSRYRSLRRREEGTENPSEDIIAKSFPKLGNRHPGPGSQESLTLKEDYTNAKIKEY